MCTLVLLWRPHATWKLLVAANRDEFLARPWQPPAAHWPAQPDVIGGLDVSGGGTWLALRRDGLLAAVLNRTGSLGPAPGKRSRGELPLRALAHPTAAAAAEALAAAPTEAWRPFNLVIADAASAWCLINRGTGPIRSLPLPPGLHMITAGDPNDPADPRIARHRPRFAATTPAPPDWQDWPALLADSQGEPREAMNIAPTNGFGTASACLVAIGPETVCRFAAAPLTPTAFQTARAEPQPRLGA